MFKTIVFSVLVAAIAVYYYHFVSKNVSSNEGNRLQHVLDGLIEAENSVLLPKSLPIAVGFGSCLDLLVDGIPLLDAIGTIPPIEPKYHESIASLQDLTEMFAFFFVQGAAAERFIPFDILQQLVASAKIIDSARWAGGGNAPVMSNRFAKDGFTNIIVGAQASKKFKSFFTTGLHFSDYSEDNDDIHLILEYKMGEKWGNYTAARANRFIVHSDQNNPYIGSLESFDNNVKKVKPRLVIVSALQMLDNFPFEDGVREKRMFALADMLKDVPKESLVHFEMASFSEVEMMASVLKHVMPHADSIGMNEQELPNVVSMIKYGRITEVASSNPRTAILLDDMREIYKYYLIHSERTLSRIHVHTLAFQAILTKKQSAWKNNKAASARASLTAHRHVCGVEKINVNNARLIMDDSFSVSASRDDRVYFNDQHPISCWDEDDYEICVAPVLVCTAVRQTVGGGDNITPAGLMPQI